jgi:hypothetical protein
MGNEEVASAAYWLHWLTVVKYVGGALVVVGVAAELLGDLFSEPLQKKMDDAKTSEIVRLATEAETARAAIAEANARALEAKVELEKYRAPRSLTDEQVARIREKVRPFSGQVFGAITYWGESEPVALTKRIGDLALIPAGWIFSKAERFEALVGIVSGIAVLVSAESDPKSVAAAKVLVEALNNEGLAASLTIDPTYKTLVKIQVGVKP